MDKAIYYFGKVVSIITHWYSSKVSLPTASLEVLVQIWYLLKNIVI